MIEELGFTPIIIDSNVDTITRLKSQKRQAIFGDASLEYIQESGYIKTASVMMITVPEISTVTTITKMARNSIPQSKLFARANYLSDMQDLKDLDVEIVCSEEETKQAFLKSLSLLESYKTK